ncbi:ras-related protein Rab-30-like [Oppia nitens]|uniref:ras-related protein Rab-30-like n=1 Tax=Oppia nitens TaxID=1686743 RepID=UPI0023DBAA0B|nr:ras-related protein Rab-30-like [Oppia nitens]
MASISAPEFKVILCGEYGVGKTSLFRRFATNSYLETATMSAAKSRQSTLGLDHLSRPFESTTGNRSLKLQLWDTGGLERVASITNSYYKFAEAALLVYSLDSLDSFHCLSQHLLEILSLAENAKIFLVGNKSDLCPHEVQQQDIDQFVEQFPKFDGHFKVSCKTADGLPEMWSQVVDQLAAGSSLSAKTSMDAAFKLHQKQLLDGGYQQSSSLSSSAACCGGGGGSSSAANTS